VRIWKQDAAAIEPPMVNFGLNVETTTSPKSLRSCCTYSICSS